MTELKRQILRAEMSHSLMNGFSAILPALAEENDAKFERLATENAKLRELVRDYHAFALNVCTRANRGPEHMEQYMRVGSELMLRARHLGVEVTE